MKKKSIFLMTFAMLLLTTTNANVMRTSAQSILNLQNPCVGGSGNTISQDRDVSNFSSVSVSTAANLIVQQGETESLTITADDNVLPQLTSEVSNGDLILSSTGCIQTNSDITYTLTVKDLSAVKVTGDVNVDLQNIDTDQLAISVDGNSDSFTASGRADELDISVPGNLVFNGESLLSNDANVNISGVADVTINVANTLNVNISGDGSVKYIGNPTVTKNINGVGSVVPRP